MASATLLFLVLVLSYEHVGEATENLFKLKCQPAVGVIGQITHISCSIELLAEPPEPVVINTVVLTRSGETKPCFTFQLSETESVRGDSRFEAKNLPSLQLHNTMISDEGEYRYYIRTSVGIDQAKFTINVTAKYNSPIINAEPKEMVEHKAADLYCSASGGYPAGTIHWFDQGNTNWTRNAELQSTLGNDGLFTLSSKLSFQTIHTNWEPFRCVVLNNKYEEEEVSTFNLQIKANPESPPVVNTQMTTNIVAGVLVIGSLIVGLLIALLFKLRRNRQLRRASACPMLSDFPSVPAYTEEEKVLNEQVYRKVGDAEENVSV